MIDDEALAYLTPHQQHEAREMRIHCLGFARNAETDPYADQARGIASKIIGIVSGGWTWPDVCSDSIKAAAVTGCYLALRWAKEDAQRDGRIAGSTDDA